MIARARAGAPESFAGGRIVNVASAAGLRAFGMIGVYALCPGYIDTEMNHAHWQTDAGRQLLQMLPRKRLGRPEDLDRR